MLRARTMGGVPHLAFVDVLEGGQAFGQGTFQVGGHQVLVAVLFGQVDGTGGDTVQEPEFPILGRRLLVLFHGSFPFEAVPARSWSSGERC